MRCRYQFRFGLLNAGAFGAPQSRHRLIIMASLRDAPLPDFPISTHAFKSQSWEIDLTDGHKLQCLGNQPAALNPVSVIEAIGDLPPFDWYGSHLSLD